jgi:uncharacterized membrane protein
LINEQVRRALRAERLIGRLLIALTYLSVVFLVVGVGLMAGAGISPMSGGPALDLATLANAIVTLDPAGFLWLGLLAVVSTPISQVLVAAVTYARSGDRAMVGIAVTILAIIVLGVATAWAATV